MPEGVAHITDFPAAWPGRAAGVCRQLEAGAILYLTGIPFDFPQADIDFLLSQRRGESRIHKNVSYRPAQDVLRGAGVEGDDLARLHAVMRGYSRAVAEFTARLLAPYAGRWTLDYASFRPLEEEGRGLPLHKRNDLLHVDAFPSRPTRGARILRVFTNIGPRPRVWLTAQRFPELAREFAESAGLRRFADSGAGALAPLQRALRALGLPVTERSAYDRFMLRFHDWLKENSAFQARPSKIRTEFPPLSTWLVMTDTVPHAVLSGQYALEQTFIVPVDALQAPESAPIRVLEKIAGRAMA
ncbi:MAG TPA: Kdo hydroxylase family protein [Terriglobales bacterium]|nr:Kdo hydroxylase family protein [Terriglobales bacterium]